MEKDDGDDLKFPIPASLVRALEEALLEYIERYGLTDRARDVLGAMGKHRDKPRLE